ncbi:MAG: hypothetical protein ACTSYA_01830 [Candidatus Kariarchaeaceae archaeon]
MTEYCDLTDLVNDDSFIETLDPTRKMIYEDLIYCLGMIYSKAKWSKIAKSKSVTAHDVFQHRLRVAAGMDTIPRVLNKLRLGLSIQSVGIEPEVVFRLDQPSIRPIALEILRRESSLMVMLAWKFKDYWWKQQNN